MERRRMEQGREERGDLYNIYLYRKRKFGKREIEWMLKDLSDKMLIAGIIAGGIVMVQEINRDSEGKNEDVKYEIDTDADIADYRLAEEIPEEETESVTDRYLLHKMLGENEYGIWIKSVKKFHYNLYKFSDASFMQGLITISNSMNMDFRKYIYKKIFNRNKEYFVLEDYVMSQDLIVVDAPDIDDIEEEEMDNENMIEPLRKDY